MNDKERISPYNIITISRRQVMRKKIYTYLYVYISDRGLIVDPISDSPN